MSTTPSKDFTISTEGPATAASSLTELEAQTLLLEAVKRNTKCTEQIIELLIEQNKLIKEMF